MEKLNKKIPDHVQYIITKYLDKVIAENFAARLKQANLVRKTDFDDKLISSNRGIILKKQNKIFRNSKITK